MGSYLYNEKKTRSLGKKCVISFLSLDWQRRLRATKSRLFWLSRFFYVFDLTVFERFKRTIHFVFFKDIREEDYNFSPEV